MEIQQMRTMQHPISTSFLIIFVCLLLCSFNEGNPDAKRLYDDLLSKYNRLIRPVVNFSDTVTIKMGIRLSQLLELNLKDQILTTNVWVEHEWWDNKFLWNPEEYGGVTELYVPAEHIWLPDIVLYNNADGDYVVTTATKAILHHTGIVSWTPPAILKSYCEINVRYFPFDIQTCFMKFGSWSYDGYKIDLVHIKSKEGESFINLGMDLQDFYPSVEWDIMAVPAEMHKKFYPCCVEPFPDIFFNITIRRKTLFYTVNLIFPCVGISYLSVLVFYLPADSNEKVALCITILISQTMFFLLVSDIIPNTSLNVPLLGRYLLFTMILLATNVVVTIVILNIHHRKPSTHRMASWVKTVFIEKLPKLLLMRVPSREEAGAFKVGKRPHGHDRIRSNVDGRLSIFSFTGIPPPPPPPGSHVASVEEECETLRPELAANRRYPSEIERAIENVRFIKDHLSSQDKFREEDVNWGFVAMVLDRLFLFFFTAISLLGTVLILYEAPSLYDNSVPIDTRISVVAQKLMGISDVDL